MIKIYNINKSLKADMRDEIEEIIKAKNIDRKRFHEFDKYRYSDIITKFYYTFFDYNKSKDISLDYLWLKIRSDTECELVQNNLLYDWETYISNIKKYFPDESKTYYLILSCGWVYEGYIAEVQKVLLETTVLLEDFYIVSKKFDKAVIYCDDGDSMSVIYKKR